MGNRPRAIALLAPLPASSTWSASSRRYAVEHPLAHERGQARGETQERNLMDVLWLIPVVVLLPLLFLFHRWLPPWLRERFCVGKGLV
jgi:hypothetical protein